MLEFPLGPYLHGPVGPAVFPFPGGPESSESTDPRQSSSHTTPLKQEDNDHTPDGTTLPRTAKNSQEQGGLVVLLSKQRELEKRGRGT